VKILMISNMYPSNTDVYFGAFVKNIEEGLRQAGAKTELIAIAGQGQNKLQKILKYFLFYIKILLTDLRKYDVVHISYPSHTFLPILVKRRKGSLIVVRFHGLEIMKDRKNDFFLYKLRRLISKIAISNSDITVVPSTYFLEEVSHVKPPLKMYKYPSGGVNRNKFYPISSKHHFGGESQRGIRIGYVGRIDVGKGLDVLLNSLKDLKFDYQLTVVGKGPLLSSYIDLTEANNLNVSFVGAVPQEDLLSYYNNFDVLVFPTMRTGESFGNVGIECMACGTPVIASNFAGPTEYVKQGVNGFFFEKGDVLSLQKVLNDFSLLDGDRRKELSVAALQTASEFDRHELSNGFFKYLKNEVSKKC
jgi:L-malate glycosyltransferase